MTASFGFGEVPPVPDEEKGGETLPGVRGVEDVAAETLSHIAEKTNGTSKENAVVSAAPEAEPEAPHETEITKESLQREVEALEHQAKELGDPELEKEAQELRAELERMPEKDREKMGVGFQNYGLLMKEGVSKWKSEGLEWIAKTQMKEKGAVAGYLSSLAETYRKDAKKARDSMESYQKARTRGTLASAGYLAGNAVKIGRTIADFTGATAMAPLRYAMMTGMFLSRGADAAKEYRFKNEEVVAKTRLDEDKALEEADRLYAEESRKKGGMSANEIAKVYRESLPKDILERLNTQSPEQPGLVNRTVQGIMRFHMKRSVARLERKAEKIEKNEKLTPAKKKEKRERLFNRFERRLQDYDRIVGQAGTVDVAAMSARYVEVGAKVAVGAAIAETVGIAFDRFVLGGTVAEFIERQEVKDAMEGLRDIPPPSEIPPAGTLPPGYDAGEAPNLKGEIIQNLREHAGMPGTTETAPADALRQPYPIAGGTFGDTPLLEKEVVTEGVPKEPRFTVSKPGASFGMPNATVETPSVEHEPAVKAPLETAPADSALAKPSSLERVEALGTKETAVDSKTTIESPAEKPAAATIGEKEIAVEPKVVKPSSGVMETKMVERATPVTEEELKFAERMRGGEISLKQMELATVGKGEGVTHAIVRQLKLNPEKFGFSSKDGANLDRWAVLKSKEIAIENGYIRPDGTEIRVLDQGSKGNPAYILGKDSAGKLKVVEYLGGKPTGGAGVKSAYEYEWKKPDVSKAAANIEPPLQKIPVKSALEAVNELPARQAVEAAASGIPDELAVRGPMDVIGVKEAAAPVLERIEVGKLPETKLPEWLTERVEYAKLAETLPEKTANLENIRDNFESYSLRMQENAVGELDAFEKQLNYLEKNVDTLGLTPSQEDFVEMSKETIDEMREMLKESKEVFKEQLADVGVSSQSYEKAIAGKGITVKELFAMEQKSELDAKKWGMFTKWVHALRPTSMEQGMEVDDFLRGLEPDNFSVKHLAVAETPVGSFMEQQSETNTFLHGLVDEYLNESKEDIPRYATALGMKPEEVERAFTELSKTKDITGDLTKLVAEHPERAHLLSAMLEVETELKPEAQELKRALDGLLSQKK